jgi:acetyl esterase/lipase
MRALHFLFAILVICQATFAGETEQIPLWPNGAPGSEGQTAPEVMTDYGGFVRISSIHNPTLTAHLPSKQNNTRAAVILLPGGGHKYLSIENEGNVAADWLAQRGVAGFVLRYRLAGELWSPYHVDREPVADARRAVRLVRSRAADWDIDADRVGLMGFSAGGEITTYACTKFDSGDPDAADPVERQSSRPSFQALIYGGVGKIGDEVPKDTPPTFMCVAFDDKGKIGIDLELMEKLRVAGVSSEMHVYARGGHGFGMRQRPLPITLWPVRFHEWLGDQGFLRTPSVAAK